MKYIGFVLLMVLLTTSFVNNPTHAEERKSVISPTQVPPKKEPTENDLMANCPTVKDLSELLMKQDFQPLFVSYNTKINETMFVWVNLKYNVSEYVISDGKHACVLYKADKTVIQVPSGLNTI